MAIPHLRSVTTPDLDAVLSIQAQCYAPGFHEPSAAFESKLTTFNSAWLACVNNIPAGYLFTLPLALGETLAMPSLAESKSASSTDAAPNCLYLHDLAVLPQYRGSGISHMLFGAAQALAQAQKLEHMALVAVQGSTPFWQSLGFVEVTEPHPSIQAKLATYGDGATFMLCSI